MANEATNTQETKRLLAYIREISEILYFNTLEENLTILEGIGQAVHQHMLAMFRISFFTFMLWISTLTRNHRGCSHRLGELPQHGGGGIKVNAGIGNALTIHKLRQIVVERLIARDEMALNHDA